MSLHKSLTTVTTLSKTLALVIFILMPIVGFLLGIQYQESITPVDIPIIRRPTPTPKQTVDMSNWKIYTGTSFSFKYPSNFTTVEENGCLQLKIDFAYLVIKLPGGTIACGQTGRGAYDVPTPLNEKVDIGGKEYDSTLGYKVDSSKDPDAKTKLSEFVRFENVLKNNSYIEYGGHFNNSDQTVYENNKKTIYQILSTFKFIGV